MTNFDVRVKWGMPGSRLTRTTIIKTIASTEEIAISVARRSAHYYIPREAEIREVRL
jgi:hypothetical protein